MAAGVITQGGITPEDVSLPPEEDKDALMDANQGGAGGERSLASQSGSKKSGAANTEQAEAKGELPGKAEGGASASTARAATAAEPGTCVCASAMSCVFSAHCCHDHACPHRTPSVVYVCTLLPDARRRCNLSS